MCCSPVLCCPCPLHDVPCLRVGSGTSHCLVPLVLHSLVLCCPLLLCIAVLLCCCVVGCGMAVVCEGVWSRCLSSSLFLPCSSTLLLLFVLVFGVVRAQPCEHARYPRTPLRPRLLLALSLSCLVFSSLFLVFLHALPFLLLERRRVIHHVSVCCVGMTATGSLSRSSSFFW